MMSEILSPKSEADLAETVASLKASGKPVRVRGGGTRLGLGNPVAADTVLDVSGINGISLYEPGALTIVANAGTPLAEIENALEAENQHLPFEPADYRDLYGSTGEPTIGAVAAAAISGPRRIQAGACRDSLIGVRFVDGLGEVVKNGGRVMKNVTGYDLVKLMCGSYGTLGVLTEVSFKLLPRPECVGTVSISGLADGDAINVLSAALGSPFDVNGAAHFQRGENGSSQTLVRIEGFEGSVKYRAESLQVLLRDHGDVAIDLDTEEKRLLWKSVRDVKPFAGREGAVWKISVKPTDGPKCVMEVQQQIPVEAIYDWGGGLIWLLTAEDDLAGAAIIRASVEGVGGHATLVRASEALRHSVDVFHPEKPGVAAISRGIKAKFDPANILNPGLMTPGVSQAAE